MKYNATSLQKLERILGEAEYKLRYERGTFQSGYCILEQKKVVVLNKFLDVEARINTLSELIPQLKINVDLLTQESQKVYAGLHVEIFPETQDPTAENSGD
ncbi:MAG: hypothetical protein V4717_00900 [Bacteroidota bacterium]